MKKEITIKKMLAAVKKTAKQETPKAPEPKLHRERDMRQEALDMGSHGAKEFFGGENNGPI